VCGCYGESKMRRCGAQIEVSPTSVGNLNVTFWQMRLFSSVTNMFQGDGGRKPPEWQVKTVSVVILENS
jgi:hypothetical protein